jgi:TetR/AcrR family transcriptional repressor of lmrAB and yxaGH operons
MPAVPKHRQPIINAAVTLFRRQGFARTGLNDIVDVSGAPKGSLYHYFPDGKSSIALAAVEEAGRRVAATVTELAAECGSTGELLRAHATLLAGWMQGSGFRNGCPITTVLLELAPGERAVSEALAVLCTSALQGALIQARVERSGRPIEVTAAELAGLIEAEVRS